MKNETWIKFKCGCEEKKKDAKYVPSRTLKSGYRKAYYYCSKHKTMKGYYKFVYCIDCGNKVAKGIRDKGTMHYRCEKCNKAATKKRVDACSKKNNEKRYKAAQEEKKRLMSLERMPRKVFSVEDAMVKNVLCIPLNKLFRFNKRISLNN